MLDSSRIFVAEPNGLIGSAIVRALEARGLGGSVLPTADLDLTDAAAVEAFFAQHRPELVFLAAGKKGGILANQRFPADLMLNNLHLAVNVLETAHRHGVKKLLYLASSCVYPRECPQPMEERMLMTGPMEPTNESYSMAKLAGLKLAQALRKQYSAPFIAAIPTNIFGLNDDFHPENAHVIGALIRRLDAAKRDGLPRVEIWGSGLAMREFLYADDLGHALCFLMERYDDLDPINIGAGREFSIRELAETIQSVVGYEGELYFDTSKPDGMPRKALHSGRLTDLGWKSAVRFEDGLAKTYAWYLEHALPHS